MLFIDIYEHLVGLQIFLRQAMRDQMAHKTLENTPLARKDGQYLKEKLFWGPKTKALGSVYFC